MAKKEIMKINYSISACKGTFDKNENGEYINKTDKITAKRSLCSGIV